MRKLKSNFVFVFIIVFILGNLKCGNKETIESLKCKVDCVHLCEDLMYQYAVGNGEYGTLKGIRPAGTFEIPRDNKEEVIKLLITRNSTESTCFEGELTDATVQPLPLNCLSPEEQLQVQK